MNDLQTTTIGGLNKDSIMATSTLITDYITGIISADSVALGGGTPDINTKAKTKNNTTSSNSIVIGHNAKNSDDSYTSSSVVAIGSGAEANNWGTAVGVGATAQLALAFGADAYASGGNSMALGRYAKATALGAVQINGDRDNSGYKAVNTEPNTMKFYCGNNINRTIVDANGKISADVLNNSSKIIINNIVYNVGIGLTTDKDGNDLSVLKLTL